MAQPAFTPLRDRFHVLQTEFEATTKRLGETTNWAEKKTMLRELRQILAELDALAATR